MTPRLYILLAAALVGLSGCMNYLAPFAVREAGPGLQSTVHGALEELPPPEDKVVIAVYRFRDQTGQYKPSDRMASWSTAVTQGATSILMRALEESGWFVPIEREGLSNLLNERQIIQTTRAQHTGPQGEALGPLPPLLYAGVLLEGGIIGYDANTITGGAGLRYFGAGASGQFRQDQVTIYLRAVSTQNGRVLKTVHTTKTILSQKLDGGLFRFVDPNRILETEAGYTYNEPPVLAVTEAIEEAVKNLVLEGIRDNLWITQTPYDAESDVFEEYDEALARAERTDYFGRLMQPNRPGLGLGFGIGALRYRGDYRDPLARPGGDLFARKSLWPNFALGFKASYGELAAERAFSVAHAAADVHALYYLMPGHRVTPYLTLGAGALYQIEKVGESTQLFPYVTAGGGLEWMITPQMGLSLGLNNDYALVEGLDGVKRGRIHDNVWSLKTGFVFYGF